MSFQHIPGLGMVHFNMAKPPRVVPGPERHFWANKRLAWGESTTCTKCGCLKHRRKTQPDYTEVYQMPGGIEVRSGNPGLIALDFGRPLVDNFRDWPIDFAWRIGLLRYHRALLSAGVNSRILTGGTSSTLPGSAIASGAGVQRRVQSRP